LKVHFTFSARRRILETPSGRTGSHSLFAQGLSWPATAFAETFGLQGIEEMLHA
jgi:hypothetical protein